MDFIAGCFHDGFMLYAKALTEALTDGVSQNDGADVIKRMQNRRIWGASSFDSSSLTLHSVFQSNDSHNTPRSVYNERESV